MNRLYTLAFALFGLLATAEAQTYLSCGFSNGIPDGFTLIDNDGNEPSVDMKSLGFSVGTPWIVLTPAGEQNPVACSTSWYKPAGQSDDWLITPPVTIANADAMFYWRAKASDKKYRDGYSVYVSASAGTTIADFNTAEPLFSVDAEENAWQLHSVSLADYAGKTITLAFVNRSHNMSRLFIDDILVARQTAIGMYAATPEGTPAVGDVRLEMDVRTTTDQPVSGFTAGYTIGNETYTQHFTTTLTPGAETRITLDKPVSISDRQTIGYTLWIENGNERQEQACTLTAYQRKVLIEEITGTWCQWCVRGIVMMERFNREASDRFVGVCVHSDDVMQNDYTEALNQRWGWAGLPNGVIARSAMADPENFEGMLRSAFNYEQVLSSLRLDATYDPATRTVSTATNVRFGQDIAQGDAYRLAFAVVENNVHHPDDPAYYQSNSAYSGGAHGEMGGWELKPSRIEPQDMYFQEVARAYSGPFDGIEGSLPDALTKDEDAVFSYSFPLPDNVDNPAEARIVVMLIAAADNHVVNAQIASMSESTPNAVISLSLGQPAPPRYATDGRPSTADRSGLHLVRYADGTVRKVLRR